MRNKLFVLKSIKNANYSPSFQVCLETIIIFLNTLNGEIQQLPGCVSQGDILTRAEKHFEELKDSFLPLPSWYQDELNKQWKSGELIFQGKG